MFKLDPYQVESQAKRELHEERLRSAIEARKEELREHRPLWWHRLFPWKVSFTIMRRT